MQKEKNYHFHIIIFVAFLFFAGVFSIVFAQTCETKQECVKESREQKRKMIESGELSTTTNSNQEYTYNVRYRFMAQEGDTVWDEIRNTHDELTPSSLDQWFENERMAVLEALRRESPRSLGYMGFSSGSIDLIYPKEMICFKALHRNKRVVEDGEVVHDSDVVYDIENCN